MRLIFGLLRGGEVFDIEVRCGLYTGAANTRVYTVFNNQLRHQQTLSDGVISKNSYYPL